MNRCRRSGIVVRIMMLLTLVGLWPGSVFAKPQTLPPIITYTVTVRESPPRITLEWVSIQGAGGYKVWRKALSDDSWGGVYGTVGDLPVPRFDDDNVAVGVGYEYKVETVNKVNGDSAYSSHAPGYVYSGISLPPPDNRGKVILLVDQSMAGALSGELARLEEDLAGDGWGVLRHDVPRQAVLGTERNASGSRGDQGYH